MFMKKIFKHFDLGLHLQGLFEGHSYISTVAKVDFLPPRTRAGTLATQAIFTLLKRTIFFSK